MFYWLLKVVFPLSLCGFVSLNVYLDVFHLFFFFFRGGGVLSLFFCSLYFSLFLMFFFSLTVNASAHAHLCTTMYTHTITLRHVMQTWICRAILWSYSPLDPQPVLGLCRESSLSDRQLTLCETFCQLRQHQQFLRSVCESQEFVQSLTS